MFTTRNIGASREAYICYIFRDSSAKKEKKKKRNKSKEEKKNRKKKREKKNGKYGKTEKGDAARFVRKVVAYSLAG